MKKRNKGLAIILVWVAIFLISFTTFAALSLDSVLLQINASGRADYGMFRTQMTISFGISRQRVDYYHTSLRMAPGDIFMVFQMAAICGLPIDRVLKIYKVHKHKGWGFIAKELGIKPGSTRFMLLKTKANGFYGKLKLKKGHSGSGNHSGPNSGGGRRGGKK